MSNYTSDTFDNAKQTFDEDDMSGTYRDLSETTQWCIKAATGCKQLPGLAVNTQADAVNKRHTTTIGLIMLLFIFFLF